MPKGQIKLILLVILLLALTALVGFFAVNKFKDPIKGNNPGYVNRGETVYDWKVPGLASGYSWHEKRATEQETKGYSFFYNSWKTPTPAGVKEFSGSISPTGVIFESSVTVSAVDKVVKAQKNFIDYSKELDWTSTLRYGDIEIKGIEADGPQGSSLGLVKRNGSQVRTVVYDYFVRHQNKPGEGEQGILSCPCDVTIKIFVSDITELRNYMHVSE